MAQDFGDDIGDIMIRSLTRAFNKVLYDVLSEYAKSWYSEKNEQKGMSKEEAAAAADVMAARPQVCIPFGTADDASYFAQVCRENDIYAAALKNQKGEGYIQFAKDDFEQVKQCIPQFSEVMTDRKNMEISDMIEKASPVTEETFKGLNLISPLPDLPNHTDTHQQDSINLGHSTYVVDDRASDAYNHTQGIRDKVLAAREQCRDLDDFKRILSKDGVGITETKDGELMFYEARYDENGEILPRGKNENGLMDWSVGAKVLANGKWQCDVTLDWFEKNTPKEPTVPAREPKELGIEFDNGLDEPTLPVVDGSLDTDGRTPDVNQGIESHDGMDTATNTARMEREQSNTDVAPSVVRESSQPRLKEVEKECRAASRQLAQSNDSPDRDISDKFQQER